MKKTDTGNLEKEPRHTVERERQQGARYLNKKEESARVRASRSCERGYREGTRESRLPRLLASDPRRGRGARGTAQRIFHIHILHSLIRDAISHAFESRYSLDRLILNHRNPRRRETVDGSSDIFSRPRLERTSRSFKRRIGARGFVPYSRISVLSVSNAPILPRTFSRAYTPRVSRYGVPLVSLPSYRCGCLPGFLIA